MVAAVKDRVIGYRERLVQAREAALYEKQKKGDMTAVYKEHLERMSRLHTRLSWLILEIRPPVEQDSFADFESLPFVPTAEGHHLCAKATWRAAGSNTTDEVSILRADLKELKTAAYELYNCLWMASLTPGWQGARLMGPIVTDDHIYLVTGIGGRTLTEVLADNPSQSERQDICRRLMMALQKLQGVVPGTFLHRLLHLSSIQMSADKQILFGGPCTAATMDDMLYLHAAACEAMEAAVTASDKRTISKIPVMLYGALCWQICDAAADQRLFHGTLDRAEAAKALLKTGKEFPEAPTDSVQWEVIRQCLAMDGWGSFQDVLLQFGLMVTPKNKRKVRILCLDGGGTRGLIETRILERIEQMTGRKIYEMFDLVCGTSTGGIISLAIAIKHFTAKECRELYTRLASSVFNNAKSKLAQALDFGVHAKYSASGLEKELYAVFQQEKMLTPPGSCKVFVVTKQNSDPSAFLLRSYLPTMHSLPGETGWLARDAARATSAAPTYFPALKRLGNKYSDGGIGVNNPCVVAIGEAHNLFPNCVVDCVVSLGTGKTLPKALGLQESLGQIMNAITDSELSARVAKQIVKGGKFFRLNPDLPMDQPETHALDVNTAGDIQKLLDITDRYLLANEELLQDLCASLLVSAEVS
eukprot:m.103111 g.103111  ORF g.103111 m.103111 type:complete len:644 (-) comp15707_c3_seq4:554-2485(-)